MPENADTAARKRLVRCPDNVEPDSNGIIGCGHVFEAELDDEGLIDCHNCGMWFNPNHPSSQPQPQHNNDGTA